MIASNQLQLVLVTPETTLLDEPVQALRFPLFDGQIGILPGRAPLVGRLGYGELRITSEEGVRSYFVDSGFVQVKGGIVTLLTNRALAPEEINLASAEEQLKEATNCVANTDADLALKLKDQERARRLLALARNK